MTRAWCLLWAVSTALQYLVTGLVHQLGSYWMHLAMLIDFDALGGSPVQDVCMRTISTYWSEKQKKTMLRYVLFEKKYKQ